MTSSKYTIITENMVNYYLVDLLIRILELDKLLGTRELIDDTLDRP